MQNPSRVMSSFEIFDTAVSDLEERLQKTALQADAYTWIGSTKSIQELVAELSILPINPPSLYVDVEGINLSRQGSISILQIYVSPTEKTYLIDIHTLGSKAFSTEDSSGCTLQTLLQSESVPKVFFDVRNDSDALFYHYKIMLAGVIDLQVMEYATRTFAKRYVNGLSKCIERDLDLPVSQRLECKRIKEMGIALFAPEKGGSYKVFNQRPLIKDIGLYCVQDVQWLPMLYMAYTRKLDKLSSKMAARVSEATLKRVKESQSPHYNGHGEHKAIGPW